MSTISGTTINTGITLSTNGSYTSPLTIGMTGAVEASSGNAVYGPTLYAWTVVNQGAVTAASGYGITFAAGGSVENLTGGLIEGYAGGVGISGAAGTITNSGTIAGGDAGGAVYLNLGGTVINSGTIQAPNFDWGVFIKNAGYLTNSQAGYIGSGGMDITGQGSVVNNGLILDTQAAGPGLLIGGAGSSVTNSGTIIGAGFGVNLSADGTIIDSGTISGGGGTAIKLGGAGGNLVVLEHGYNLGGGVVASGAANTLELAGSVGAAVTVSYNALGLTGFQDVLFGTGGNNKLNITDTAALPGTISGFGTISDVVELTQLSPVGAHATLNGSDQLVVSNGSQSVTLQLDTSGNYTGIVWQTGTDGTGGTDVMPCFYRGTKVLTPAGERNIETLAPGDLVITVAGRTAPIRWIGRRVVSRLFADPLRVLPIRIAAGALDGNVPSRDLLVSPDHAVLIDDILVHAGALVNGSSIRREPNVPVIFTYYHIELAEHALILAENTPAETFIDNLDRMAFDNWEEHQALDGGADAPLVEMDYPRAKAHRQVPLATRARLADRAAALQSLAAVA